MVSQALSAVVLSVHATVEVTHCILCVRLYDLSQKNENCTNLIFLILCNVSNFTLYKNIPVNQI